MQRTLIASCGKIQAMLLIYEGILTVPQQVVETPKGRNIRRWQWVSFAEYQDGGFRRINF